MGALDFMVSKEQRLLKLKEKQDKKNAELRAEIMFMNAQKETKLLQKERDDLMSETMLP